MAGSSSIFFGDLLWLLCCLQQIIQISCNDRRQSWFFFQTMKVFCFGYLRSILYFDECENNCKNVFLSISSCLKIFNYLCSSTSSTSISEHESLDEQLSIFEIWVLDSILSLCEISFSMVSKINNLINKLLSVILGVFHCWK